jgi:signal transduction histidine kinase
MVRLPSIATKIFLGYLVAVICSTGVTVFLFHTLTRDYVEAEVGRALARRAQALAEQLAEGNQNRSRVPIPLFAGQILEGDFVVTDREGTVLFGSAPAEFPPGNRIQSLLPGPPSSTPTGRIAPRRHRDYLAAVAPLPPAAQAKGSVVLFVPRKALEDVKRNLFAVFLKSFGAGLIVSLAGTWLIAGRLTRPLRLLKEKAQAVARREFDARIDLDTQDELGELARAFNQMAAALKEHETAVKRFLQHTSHELRTPLTSIQGYAEGVKDGVFQGNEAERAVEIIAQEAKRLRGMVEELLYLARLESPEERYEFQPVNAAEILSAAVDGLGGYAAERGISVASEVPPDLTLWADAAKLRRLFDNVLANGIRHAQSRVLAAARCEEGRAIFTFSDDGPGFAPEDLVRAFEPYHKGRRGGSGLGLAIVRAIAEKHGGRVTAANSKAGGAAVTVTLPLRRAGSGGQQ